MLLATLRPTITVVITQLQSAATSNSMETHAVYQLLNSRMGTSCRVYSRSAPNATVSVRSRWDVPFRSSPDLASTSAVPQRNFWASDQNPRCPLLMICAPSLSVAFNLFEELGP
jgi:hypothetical protein